MYSSQPLDRRVGGPSGATCTERQPLDRRLVGDPSGATCKTVSRWIGGWSVKMQLTLSRAESERLF